ncbi:trp RNA-binding attenuation protein MtrB [Gemelliphila asaccharolytica]|uniref:Transcription attenuation protein MtrB family protein n=1 Tax=Gemelliphila asaccharolytica TaxID=502393 RepID=A0ABR5TMV1_9BACL|nr:trp RNA-binding attenuation protein MtrB [Gemella asaccharolytica]KXB58665.1 transcription attenuation protein MtrB family protein [Gemella asaccharolytica]
MKDATYILIRGEENNVKVITKLLKNEENLEIINQGEVLLINLSNDILSLKISGKARIISQLNPIISE